MIRPAQVTTVVIAPPEQTQDGFNVVNVSVLGATYQLGQDLLNLFSLAQDGGEVSDVLLSITTSSSAAMI